MTGRSAELFSAEVDGVRFGAAAIVAALVLIGFHLWNAFAGLIPNLITRPAHLALALPWIFVLGAAAQQGRAARLSGWLFMAVGLTICALIMLNRRDLIHQYGALNGPVQIALAAALIVVVLEMARRAIKIVLPAVAALVHAIGEESDRASPDPAIWISERGRSSNRLFSTLATACTLFGHIPGSSTGGMARSRARSVDGFVSSAAV